MAEERLQKVLARAGIASRRAAESLITAGRVRVDGRIVSELGVRVNTRAKIEVDGRVVLAESLVYIVLHKPRGVVCTLRDPEGRPTVAEYLKDVGARVVPVGRLDFHTSGALICTNDGELASKLTHPRHHAKKEYVAKVGGVVDERTLERLSERIVIDGRATQPAEVRVIRVEDGKTWVSVKLGEGRNRQVRRLGEHAGVPVMRLVRVAHAGITSEGLRPGEWRRLSQDELRALKQEYGVPRRIHAVDPQTTISRGGQLALRQPTATRRARDTSGKVREPARGRDSRSRDSRSREPERHSSDVARYPREQVRPTRGAAPAMREGRPTRGGAPTTREPARPGRPGRSAGRPARHESEPNRHGSEPGPQPRGRWDRKAPARPTRPVGGGRSRR